MRLVRTIALSVLVVALTGVIGSLSTAPANAQASPCPPGQPPGRPPGTPPNQPGRPAGRPPAYPPGKCSLQLSTAAAQRGQSFQATGNGFNSGEAVVFSLGGAQVASGTADALGNVSASLTVPMDAPVGGTEVLASSATRELTAAFEVLARAELARSGAGAGAAASSAGAGGAGTGTGLASTGVYVGAGVLLGAVLIALGIALVLAARRRRRGPLAV